MRPYLRPTILPTPRALGYTVYGATMITTIEVVGGSADLAEIINIVDKLFLNYEGKFVHSTEVADTGPKCAGCGRMRGTAMQSSMLEKYCEHCAYELTY